MEKDVQNTDAVARKLGPALIRATNYRLEIVRNKRQKKEEIVKKRKIEAMTAKRCKDKKGINLSNEEKRNYKSNIGDNTDLDQTNNKYLL